MGGHSAMPTSPRVGAGKSPAVVKLLGVEKNGRPAKMRALGGKQRQGEQPAAEDDHGALGRGGAEPSRGPRQKRRKISEDAEEGSVEETEDEGDEAKAGAGRKASEASAAAAAAARDGALSDSEVEAMNALRAVVASETAVAVAGGGADAVDWRAGLKQLREQREGAAEQPIGKQPRLEPDQLLALVRSCLKDRKWSGITASSSHMRDKEMSVAVQRLELSEAATVFKACAERHESEPKERAVCQLWIHQILQQHNVEALLSSKCAKRSIRPLLNGLDSRLGTSGAGSEVLSCLGKWRYVAELAGVRRATLGASHGGGSAKDSAAVKGAAAATVIKAALEESDEDEDEDEADEDDDADEDADDA
mmetsp:Transcript_73189/g.210189  ORF Transcript_73189/g.210189 Transcript_73189/m.210189 type:complete len:364 (-) Transcript_73189:138-1229(-)